MESQKENQGMTGAELASMLKGQLGSKMQFPGLLGQEIEVQERQNENVEKFIQTAHKYVGIDKLDGYALRELVSAIYVDAPDKSSGKRVQHIHIQYDGLGFIPLNELMKEETA